MCSRGRTGRAEGVPLSVQVGEGRPEGRGDVRAPGRELLRGSSSLRLSMVKHLNFLEENKQVDFVYI